MLERWRRPLGTVPGTGISTRLNKTLPVGKGRLTPHWPHPGEKPEHFGTDSDSLPDLKPSTTSAVHRTAGLCPGTQRQGHYALSLILGNLSFAQSSCDIPPCSGKRARWRPRAATAHPLERPLPKAPWEGSSGSPAGDRMVERQTILLRSLSSHS